MARDQLVRMEVDTAWLYHRHWRAVQREDPEGWPVHAVAWFALLGESWRGLKRVTLEDAWPAGLAYPIDLTKAILTRNGLLDKAGKIPRDSWDEWTGPTLARVEAGRKAAAVRWGTPTQSDGNATAMPVVSRERENREGVRGERGERGSTTGRKRPGNGSTGPTAMRDAMAAAGFDPDRLPGAVKGD